MTPSVWGISAYTLVMMYTQWWEVVTFLFGGLSWRHTPPLPTPAAVWTRFQLHRSSDMCRALETTAKWLRLTSIFPDRPYRRLLGKQGTTVRVSVVRRLVTGGQGEGAGFKSCWGLFKSWSNTGKKEGMLAHHKCGSHDALFLISTLKHIQYFSIYPIHIPFTRISTVLLQP